MTVEALYEDDDFNDTLLMQSRKNLLPFDDYRQEVFLHLLEEPTNDVVKAAQRIAKRMKRKQIREATVSLDALGDNLPDTDYPSVLWEDRHVVAS